MGLFELSPPFWRHKTELSKAEKAEFAHHYELAIRLALWWEDHAYFADIAAHWHEAFAFGEFDPITREWVTKRHRKIVYHATAKDNRVVPIRDYFMPATVADAIVGVTEIRSSKYTGRKHAYAETGVLAYPNWPTEQARFLHLDVDYPYSKQHWKDQGRTRTLRIDPGRHAMVFEEQKARELDRQVLHGLGALVIDSNTGLHAHLYLAEPIAPADGRDLIAAIDGVLTGHIEQTNLGAFGDWDRRQAHLPLPIPRSRTDHEFMRVPPVLIDYFVEPDDWTRWKPVLIQPRGLVSQLAQDDHQGSGLQPEHHLIVVGADAPASLDHDAGAWVGSTQESLQQELLRRIRTIFEPYLDATAAGPSSIPSIVDGHSPVVPDIEEGDSQAWFLAGHIHRFATWADAEAFVLDQSSTLGQPTRENRLAVARWMWHAGAGRYSDGVDAALTPALLARVASEVINRLQPSGNLVKGRLQAKRLRIGVGILSSLLDARKKKGNRFFKTFKDLAVAYDEPDDSNLGKRTLLQFFEPFFKKVDDGDVRCLPRQEWPTNIYEPTTLGSELLALSPPHPSPTTLVYRSVEYKQPLRRSRSSIKATAASGLSRAWTSVLRVGQIE